MKKILGISAFYHDSAAAVIHGNKIVAAAQEERFNRIKHSSDFPAASIKYCLEASGFSIDELDAVVFYDKPLLKFERLLETYYAFSPKGLLSFLKAIPVWLDEKLFLKKKIYEGLEEVMPYHKKNLNLLFSEHHLSHAASAFYPSTFEKAAILTIDGVGEYATTTISMGQNQKIETLKEMHFPHSIGLLYSTFTYFLGFKVNSGEYKLMGLAPYGDANSGQTRRFVELIKTELIDIKEDGSIWMNPKWFSYAYALQMCRPKQWETLFGLPKREAESPIESIHCNLAFAIQQVTEEIVLLLAKETKRLTRAQNLCIAGGVALNCVANGKLLQSNLFENIYVQPASGDAGGSLGAALAVQYHYFEEVNEVEQQSAYLGPYFSDKEIESLNLRSKATVKQYKQEDNLLSHVADYLNQGKVVGWFQGRMEFGPRALGNRSILADPTAEGMQEKVNRKIKKRESFRPFAPVILEEKVSEYFEIDRPSPYMLFVAPISEKYRHESEKRSFTDLQEQLKQNRSKLQAITHVDYSARIQTVNKNQNPRLYQLIEKFEQISGYPVLINTSFNLRGEPIVCTPEDAFNCFMSSEMDMLVINNFVYLKKEQDHVSTEAWITKPKMD